MDTAVDSIKNDDMIGDFIKIPARVMTQRHCPGRCTDKTMTGRITGLPAINEECTQQ